MQRLTTIILLITFAFNFIGAGFMYNTWLLYIKQNVKQKLEQKYEEKETLIKVSQNRGDSISSDIIWHEDYEFEYRGQMYDVIRKEVHGDEIWYYCHWDKAETKLLNNLSQYVSDYLQQRPNEKQKKTLFQALLDKLFLGFSSIFSPTLYDNVTSIGRQLSVQSIFKDVEAPPPRPAKCILPIG